MQTKASYFFYNFFSIILIVSFLYMPNIVKADSDFSGGAGTESDPYQINNCQQLQAINLSVDYLDKYFILESNFSCSNTTTLNEDPESPGNYFGFEPIGSCGPADECYSDDYSYTFSGSLNGNGKTVTGLYINRPTISSVGLFGYISNGKVFNLNLANVNITGDSNVGGIFGENYGGSILNSSVTGSVTGGQSASIAGGVGGYNDSGLISNSNSSATVTGADAVGGLVGFNYLGTISHSYATGNIISDGIFDADNMGGLVGYNEEGPVSNSYSTGNVTGGEASKYIGGLVGFNTSGGIITRAYSTSSVSGYSYIGGLLGYNDEGSVSDSYYSGAVSGERYIGGLIGSNYGLVSNSYSTGSVIGSDYIVGGLIGESYDNNINKCYSESNVNGFDWGIGGLIGYLSGGSINNSYSTGSITGNPGVEGVGGLVGYNEEGSVSNSYSSSVVNGGIDSYYVGGLLGYNDGVVSTSYSSGLVSGSIDVGGLLGWNYGGEINNTYSISPASGTSNIGGLIGRTTLAASKIRTSYSAGLVSGTTNGGLLGLNSVGGSLTSENNFWDNQTTNQTSSATGTEKTTELMKQQATFTGWNFTDIWSITEEVTYPVLISVADTPVVSYTLTLGHTGQGSLEVNGSVYSSPITFVSGETVVIRALPDSGQSFTSFEDASTNPVRIVTMSSDKNLSATFSDNFAPPTTYVLTYSAGAGGILTGDVSQTVNSGLDGSAVTAVPNSGYSFLKWSDDSTANPRTDLNVSGDVSVTAIFDEDETLPVEEDEPTPTAISSSGGTNIPVRYAYLISIGDLQTAENLKKQYPYLFNETNISGNTNNTGKILFKKDLYLNYIDVDVKRLQQYLNTHGFILTTYGLGSPGNETNKFGALTKKELIKFQEAHAKDILTPIGYTKGTGKFGPMTRNFINSILLIK